MNKQLFPILISIVLIGLSACGAAQLPLPADLALSSTRGSQQMVAFLYHDEQGARLVNRLSIAGDRPVPLDPPEQQVWLGELELPASLPLVTAGGVQYGLVIAEGNWLSAGRYGPGGGWVHMLESPNLRPFTPETATPAALLADGRFEDQVVRVRAALIIASGASLLVDEIGPGGVPAARARQIKVVAADQDRAALERLRTGGAARFGLVDVIGRWRQGRLETLLLSPLP